MFHFLSATVFYIVIFVVKAFNLDVLLLRLITSC
jgi:hypothetical protein